MRLAAAAALSLIYTGATLAWGGITPEGGRPWWIFVPFIVTFGAGALSWMISSNLPVPWAGGRRYGSPPRRVRLSWRTAFRFPVYLPMLVLLYYLYWSLSRHFDIGWVVYVFAALVATVVAFVAPKRRREFRLLRDGEVAVGMVEGRSDTGEGPDRIAYRFTTARGTTVSDLGWDAGYGLAEGSSVPVFYDAGDPGDHVIACDGWFEAD